MKAQTKTESINNITINKEKKDKSIVLKEGFTLNKEGKKVFSKGNQLARGKGRPKNKPFSLKEDLLKSLKELKRKDKKRYWNIITSYWEDPKMRAFLMEQIDGKAKQSLEVGALQSNPIRILEIVSE